MKKQKKTVKREPWSAYEALTDCERRLAEALTARDKSEQEVQRLRGLIDSHEREAEQRHSERARTAIASAKGDYEILKGEVRAFVAALDDLRAVK